MTFSLLACDPDTGALGAVAATGSLCVGGWVLRGRWGAGLSASQGAAPSTFWGEEALDGLAQGLPPQTVIDTLTGADPGCGWRQLAVLGMDGTGAAFTGIENTPELAQEVRPGSVGTGNMLSGSGVVAALLDGYVGASGGFGLRLLSALRAAEQAGGDARGLQSAALLILRADHAPLSLRVDHHDTDPIGALEALHARATSGDYAAWAAQVPCPSDRNRVLTG